METSKKYCPNCGAKLTSEAQTSKGKNSQDTATAESASVVVSKRLDRWATSVTKKNGITVKPKWLIGAFSAAVVIIGVALFLLIPRGIGGTYTYHDQSTDILDEKVQTSDKFTFRQNQYTYQTMTKSANIDGTPDKHTYHERNL